MEKAKYIFFSDKNLITFSSKELEDSFLVFDNLKNLIDFTKKNKDNFFIFFNVFNLDLYINDDFFKLTPELNSLASAFSMQIFSEKIDFSDFDFLSNFKDFQFNKILVLSYNFFSSIVSLFEKEDDVLDVLKKMILEDSTNTKRHSIGIFLKNKIDNAELFFECFFYIYNRFNYELDYGNLDRERNLFCLLYLFKDKYTFFITNFLNFQDCRRLINFLAFFFKSELDFTGIIKRLDFILNKHFAERIINLD